MSGKNWQQQKARLQQISLPNQVRCTSCSKNLLIARFSNKELDEYRTAISRQGNATSHRPTCRLCKGDNQQEEFQCHGCDRVKPRDDFAKAQLKDPDHAKCRDCQQRISDQEANLGDALQELSIEREIETGSSALGTGAGGGYSSAAQDELLYSSHRTASARSPASETGSDEVFRPYDNFGPARLTASNVSRVQSTSSPQTSNRPRTESNLTTSTSNSRTTSSTAATWSQQYPPSQVAALRPDRSQQNNRASPSDQFAKVRAYRPDTRTRVATRVATRVDSRQEEETPIADDDDDDDDDDEDPY